MWVTVAVLATAVNFEPTRPTLVPLMLARPRPIAQLAALYLGIFSTGMIAGLLTLFVFHRTPLGDDPVNGGRAQIAIGLLAWVIAALTASNFLRRRGDSALVTAEQRPVEKVAEHARNMLRKGNSAWVSFLLGLGIGLPSVDFLAVLVVIGASGAPPPMQITALLVFLVLGNAFIAIPLAAYVLAPHRTNRRIGLCQSWIRNRTRRQIAAVLIAIGVIQIGLGASTLWQHGDQTERQHGGHDAATASPTGLIGAISGT